MKLTTTVLCAHCGRYVDWNHATFRKTPRRRRYFLCHGCMIKTDVPAVAKFIDEALFGGKNVFQRIANGIFPF